MMSVVDLFKDMRQFDCSLNGKKLDVFEFFADEALSGHFTVHATVVAKTRLQGSDFAGKEGLFTLLGRKLDRHYHGVVRRFEEFETRGRYYLYRVTLVPRAWEQTLISDIRIFQDKTVPDIVAEVLKSGGLQANGFEFRTHQSYAPREYCVQYRETNWAFVSRILAEEGIFFYYECTEANHILVFGDTPVCHKPIAGMNKVLYTPPGQLVELAEYVTEFRAAGEVVSGKTVLKDYHFQSPSYKPASEKGGGAWEHLALYDYPGYLTDEPTGQRLAAVSLERAGLAGGGYAGKSLCRGFAAGHLFTLVSLPHSTADQEFLLTGVIHRGTQPQSLQELAPEGESNTYSNEFTCIPSQTPYRPPLCKKPSVEGVQTAVVTGPEGQEIYTDSFGRIKVQYHWDRQGNSDAKSSCWMRVVQSLSGSGWGSLFIPRIGQEVVVSFIDGDPDRPLVTGALYNGGNMPPYPLPEEKTKSTIKTRSTPGGDGFNELRFEDKKGAEEIYIHGEKDWNVEIKNDKTQTIGHDETLDVKNDRKKTTGNDQRESVGNNKEITVTKNHTESVGENMAVTVGKNLDESTGENKRVSVGKNRNESVGENETVNVGGDRTLSVSRNSTTDIGNNRTETIGKQLTLDVGEKANVGIRTDLSVMVGQKTVLTTEDQITFVCGSSSITLKQNGTILISGADIKINASGKLVTKGQNITGN